MQNSTDYAQLIPARELVEIQYAFKKCDFIIEEDTRKLMKKAIARIAAESADAGRKRRYNKQFDSVKRLLIGARLPKETVENYRDAAKMSGRSLYQFVADALEREYKLTVRLS
ncbi:MAG: hypothetical protein IJ072_05680 [Oscillospiraceae bacterium]|nr:hypothetical protein [Oscillospiraceae bacterium]